MVRKCAFTLAVCLMLVAGAVHAQTRPAPERDQAVDVALLSTRVMPGVDFTLQPGVRPLYASLAYGVDLLGWLPLARLPFVAPAVGIDYTFIPVQAETSVSSVAVGLGAAAVVAIDRFQVTAAVLGGGYFSFFNGTVRDSDGAAYPEQSGAAGYYSAGADVSFLVTPYLSLGIGGLYHDMLGLYRSVRAHVNATLHLDGFRRHVNLRDIELSPIFPALLQYYGDEPVVTARVTNEERFPVSNVRVELLIPDYMSAARTGTSVQRLMPGESMPVSSSALLSDRALTLTEGGRVPAEITIRYELNGREQQTVFSQEIRLHHRNALTWDDDRKAAALVTAKDPEVIRFASAVAGTVRREGPASVNPNLRLAIGMFEALSAHGMSYVIDPNTPAYVDASANTQIIDFLQYPRQTLDYRGGDCDDMSILYCALLEAVGVPTAFVTIPGHIFTAVSLDMSSDEARRMLLDSRLYMDVDGEAWLPVEITLVGEPFSDAWEVGADQWHRHGSAGSAGFFPTEASWQIYPPSGYPAEGSEDSHIAVSLPDQDEVLRFYRRQIVQLVQLQLLPQVEALRARIQTSDRPARELNRLGALYARYGLMEEARSAFEQAVSQEDYAPALVNLGNLYYIAGELRAALTYYERAALILPNEPAVLLSLSRVNYELDRFAQARAYLAQVEQLDAELGERYGYLAAGHDTEARAADAELRHSRMLWLEGEQ